MSNSRKLNQPTKLKLSDIEDAELRQNLEFAYESYKVQRELDVENQRSAAIQAHKSKIQQSQAEISRLEFLEKAGTAFSEIQQEPIWFVYKKDGEVIIESPFTEKDMRNAVRVQRASLNKQVEQLCEDDNNDLYESSEDEES